MIRKLIPWLAAAALLLAGCSTGGESTPVIPTKRPSGSETEVVRTLVPADTPSAADLTAATGYPAATKEQASPSAGITPSGYPAGEPTVTPSVPGTPTAGKAAAPFHDCARTPGIIGCDPHAVAISARLALVDSTANRAIALDLFDGTGWQAAVAGDTVSGPAWSPDGKELLVPQGGQHFAVYDAAGNLLETFETSEKALPAWQADNTLSKDGSVSSSGGERAVLEHTQDDRWLLHIRPKQGAEKVLTVVGQPTDQLFLLRGWMPTGPGREEAVLAQRYYADNAAMTQGGELILINSLDGTIRPLRAKMSLSTGSDAAGSYAWSPSRAELLAFLETAHGSVLAPRLGLLDVNTGKVSYPLPEGVVVTGLAWRPDGTRLALAVMLPAEAAPAEIKQTYPAGGIYLYNPADGKVEAVTAAPNGSIDGSPGWSHDGQILLYGRAVPQASGALGAQARARRLSDGQEWTFVDGVPAPEVPPGGVIWGRVLSIGAR